MKRTSKIKRVACIGLVFLMSINSFATSVTDNDGSAFITKAEFDALKSNFQAQIDTYNQNLDSKIDNAVASYLSGIKINKNIDLLPETIVNNTITGCIPNLENTNFTNTNTTDPRYDTDWVLRNPYTIANARAWKDIGTGEVSGIYYWDGSSAIGSQQFYTAYYGKDYYFKKYSGGTYSYDTRAKTEGNVIQCSTTTGVAKNTLMHEDFRTNVNPMTKIFVDDGLVVRSWDDTTPLILDIRWARGLYGATSSSHYTYFAGINSGTAPTEKTFSINTIYGTSDLEFRCGDSWANASAYNGGTFYALARSAQMSMPSRFIYTQDSTSSVRALDYKKSKIVLDSKKTAVAYTSADTSDNLSCAINNGNYNRTSYFILSHIIWEPITKSTTIPTSAKVTVTADAYPRIYIKELKVDNGSGYVNKAYEGIPLVKISNKGTVKLKLKFNNPGTYWAEPSADKIQLYIKKGPFNFNDKTNCINYKYNGVTSTCNELPQATDCEISFDADESATYYILWNVKGYSYGGTLVNISDIKEELTE